jgi:hypothetical protein
MKILISVIMVLAIIMSVHESADAQKPQKFTLRPKQQKSLYAGKLKVQFIEVMEDSRCPTGVNCVWAGNAKVKIKVTSKRLGEKIFEANTNGGPQGDQFDGYAIVLDKLTPYPKADKPIGKATYRVTISVSRLVR